MQNIRGFRGWRSAAWCVTVSMTLVIACGDDSDGGSGGVGITCHLNLGGPGCNQCVASSCGDELEAATGTRGIPTRPGGVCSGYLQCLSGCPCDNDDCGSNCFDAVDFTCFQALNPAGTCIEQSCGSVCEQTSTSTTVSGSSCGDGQVSFDEICEPNQSLSQTCTGLGFDGGDLACNANCGYDTSGCTGTLDTCQTTEGTVSVGSTHTGTLETTDRSEGSPRGGNRFDLIALELSSGQSVRVSMTADFDTYLYLMNPDCVAQASNDDGSSGTNSELDYTASTTGTHYIVATAFTNAEGAYSVSVSSR